MPGLQGTAFSARKRRRLWLVVGWIVVLALTAAGRPGDPAQAAAPDSGRAIVGRLLDPQGEPVGGATACLFLNGDEAPTVEATSDHAGIYVLDLPPTVEVVSAHITFSRHHFQPLTWQPDAESLATLADGHSLSLAPLEMARQLSAGFWLAGGIFALMLALIATEWLQNTLAALLGAVVVLTVSLVGGALTPELFIIDFEGAIEHIDWEVIFLLLGMMIAIGIIEETGIFQWLAYQAYRLSRGRAWLLVTILMMITAVASALLDNVTTMLMVAPITLQIALSLEIDPLSLILPEVLASNVGGISTLIGTPTNILIGSYAGLEFSDFLLNLTPGVLLAQAALIGYVLVFYRRSYRQSGEPISPALLSRLRDNARIRNPDQLRKSGLIFSGILLLFFFGEQFHLVPAVTALLGAVVMLIWVNPDVERMLKVVDWTTLMFFIGLFIVVGAVQEVGLIAVIAGQVGAMVGENLVAAILVLVWSSALLSGVIANIPFTAAMLPLVGFLTRTVPGAGSNSLFYALSVGSAMGGNSSMIGASANLVTVGIAERAGYPITFRKFLAVGFPAMLITVAVGSLWLLIRF